jgi:acylphosphatase
MTAVVRRRVIVHGQVQGVWFRESARRLAEQHAVAGWARNMRDGTVEAVFEGEEDAVARLVEFCRLGPPQAIVTHVDEMVEEPAGLTGFATR